MKKVLAVGLCLGLAGCGAGGFADRISTGIVATRDFLANPQTQVAAKVLVSAAKSGAMLVSCFVGAGSGIALAVEQQGKTDGQYATGIVYSASSKLCVTLGGSVMGEVVAQGGEPVVVK